MSRISPNFLKDLAEVEEETIDPRGRRVVGLGQDEVTQLVAVDSTQRHQAIRGNLNNVVTCSTVDTMLYHKEYW